MKLTAFCLLSLKLIRGTLFTIIDYHGRVNRYADFFAVHIAVKIGDCFLTVRLLAHQLEDLQKYRVKSFTIVVTCYAPNHKIPS